MTTTSAGRLQEAMNDYWTRRAPAYDDYQRRPERRDVDRAAWSTIWSKALPAAPARVLDVGTGSGHVAFLLAELGHDVTGIDLSAGMLARAREHAADHERAPRFARGDAVAPDPESGPFDAITGRYVLWTLRDPLAAVQRWRDLLRPGGVVAMADSLWFPDGFGDLYGAGEAMHLPLAEAESIERSAEAMRKGGLVDVEVRELHSILELDQVYGVAPGHKVQLQYLITGRTPG